MIPGQQHQQRHEQQDEHRRLIWETALDRLELDVMRAEQMAAQPASFTLEPWDEPHLDGPMPDDLVERALELRDRQQRVRSALVTALGALTRQHAFAERVDRATARVERPVYVDVSA